MATKKKGTVIKGQIVEMPFSQVMEIVVNSKDKKIFPPLHTYKLVDKIVEDAIFLGVSTYENKSKAIKDKELLCSLIKSDIMLQLSETFKFD